MYNTDRWAFELLFTNVVCIFYFWFASVDEKKGARAVNAPSL